MRRSQGRYFSEDEIKRIKQLLSSTEMTLQEIALRMGCARSSVANINQTFQIREYRGRRTDWVVSQNTREGTSQQIEAGSIPA